MNVERLEDRTTPSLAYSAVGPGPTEVSDALGYAYPYGDYTGIVNTAVVETQAPVSGSQPVYEYVAIPGPGGSPRLTVGAFDGSSDPKVSQFVFDDAFRGGVNIDASAEYIVLGAGTGGGPRVEVLDARTLEVVSSFFAYDPSFRGGVNVALDGDEILVGPGVGGGPEVRVLSLSGEPLSSFLVASDDPRGGVRVASVSGLVDTLSGTTLTSYDTDGNHVGSTAQVPIDTTSIGRGSYSAALVPKVTIGTFSGDELEYDLNPLFLGGRLIDDFPLSGPGYAAYVGNATQEDGVARFMANGGFESTGFSYALDPSQYPLGAPVSPTPGAYAIGELDGGTGSLTGYVQDAQGNILGLTNHHVVSSEATGDTYVGKPVYQPGPAFPGSTPIGNVVSWTPAVNHALNDSATFSTSSYDPRTAYTDWNGNLGYIQAHGEGNVQVGDLVYKFGFWGTREGIVVATGFTLSVQGLDGNTYEYDNQIIVASAEGGISWIIPGDSGSLVTSYDGTRVAQVFAGNGTIGAASPIQTVTESLGVSFMN